MQDMSDVDHEGLDADAGQIQTETAATKAVAPVAAPAEGVDAAAVTVAAAAAPTAEVAGAPVVGAEGSAESALVSPAGNNLGKDIDAVGGEASDMTALHAKIKKLERPSRPRRQPKLPGTKLQTRS
ncbi:hypothetical protein ABBQ32_004447 [Trebouxia sp. C0010 RCD-2024]